MKGIFVVRFPAGLTDESKQKIRKEVEEQVPTDVSVVVLDKGMEAEYFDSID